MIPGCEIRCDPSNTVPCMNDTQIAWTRTTVNSLWLGLLVWLNARYEWGIDFESPWIILVVGFTAGIVWRLSHLVARVKYLGYVLFGIDTAPRYRGEELGLPAALDDAGVLPGPS